MKYGIDVAKWNGTVDWAKVRASNMASGRNRSYREGR